MYSLRKNLDFDIHSEIQEVYLHTLLFKLAEGLVAIFIPFYILELGFTIPTIFMFFLLYYGMNIVAPYPLGKITTRIGYKHISLISSIFILAFYLILRSAENTPTLYTAAIIGGLGFNMYWAGMNPEVAKSEDDGEEEEETGLFFSMPAIASIFSPLLGGVILYFANFSTLFLTATSLMFISFTPFAYTEEHTEGMNLSINTLLSRDMLTDIATYLFEGAHSVAEKIIWPIYLATVIGGSLNIGGAGTMIALGGAITSIAAGKHINKDNKPKTVLIGSILAGITLVMMSQVTTNITAFIVSMLHGLTYTLVNLPIFSTAVQRAEQKNDVVEYFVLRQIMFGIGKTLVILTTLAIYLNFQENFYIYSFTAIAILLVGTGYFAKLTSQKTN